MESNPTPSGQETWQAQAAKHEAKKKSDIVSPVEPDDQSIPEGGLSDAVTDPAIQPPQTSSLTPQTVVTHSSPTPPVATKPRFPGWDKIIDDINIISTFDEINEVPLLKINIDKVIKTLTEMDKVIKTLIIKMDRKQRSPKSGAIASDTAMQPSSKNAEEEKSSTLSVDAKAFDRAKKDEEELLVRDREKLDSFTREAETWAENCRKITKDLPSHVQKCAKILVEATSYMDTIDERWRGELDDRQKGLDLIGKMIDRLVDKTKELGEIFIPSSTFKELSAADWGNMPKDPKLLDNRLKQIHIARYKTITELRETGEKLRKKFLYFAEKQLFPVLDGIFDGEKYAETLTKELEGRIINEEKKDSHLEDIAKQSLDSIDKWHTIYGRLRQNLYALLEKVSIFEMNVEKGSPINYEQHEPFDVTQDLDMNNEAIKSVVRNGYTYRSGENEQYIIRAAQVVVIKNQ